MNLIGFCWYLLAITLCSAHALEVKLFWHPYGSSNRTIWGDIQKYAVNPELLTIVVAIQDENSGWWGPKTYMTLSSKGTFVGTIGDAPNDIYAVRLCAWLGFSNNISTYGSISILGETRVNISTINNAIFFEKFNRYVLDLNGYAFIARTSFNEREGPNNNFFSNNSNYVYIDRRRNQLHLNIWYDETENKTYCSEVFAKKKQLHQYGILLYPRLYNMDKFFGKL